MQDLNNESQPKKQIEIEHDFSFDHDELAEALEYGEDLSEKNDKIVQDQVLDSLDDCKNISNERLVLGKRLFSERTTNDIQMDDEKDEKSDFKKHDVVKSAADGLLGFVNDDKKKREKKISVKKKAKVEKISKVDKQDNRAF